MLRYESPYPLQTAYRKLRDYAEPLLRPPEMKLCCVLRSHGSNKTSTPRSSQNLTLLCPPLQTVCVNIEQNRDS